MRNVAGWIVAFFLGCSFVARGEDGPAPEEIRNAIEKALPLLDAASQSSAKQKKCFTCHHQGLAVLAFVDARRRGFAVDEANLAGQVAHTAAHLKRGKSNYLKGIGQGGKADTAGAALWSLEVAGYPRDEVTNAVVDFLLQWNDDTPNWAAQSKRPPSEGSRFTSTFLALRGLAAYGFEEKEEAIEGRRTAARHWLIATEAQTTEDLVFRLRALAITEADDAHIAKAAEDLFELQGDNGGWSQLSDLKADAYATGATLVALHRTGQMDATAVEYRRGLKFLIDSQKQDGSWHVVSRSRPIQEFYDSGFPHGDDQFISCSATAWATLALLPAVAEEK